MEDTLLVGRVARAHGNRGQVIVNLETDFPEDRFKVGQVMLVGDRQDSRRIIDVRFHQGRPVVGFEGVTSMNDAEALAGVELRLPLSSIGALPEGTYYRHDLVGCDVRDAAGNTIGRVTGVEGTIDRSRLVIEGARGEEILIPMVAGICVRVDPAARVIVVEPPEGLLDLNARGGERSAAGKTRTR